ncbi:MAG: DUF433 domain-containing protein [Phototrophicaceae bacterium]
MFATPIALEVPIHTDADGEVRVSGTRVTLYTLLRAYQRGDTPQEIHEGFPSVPLADIYLVIGYYLDHQSAVDAYLQQIEADAGDIQQQLEALYTPEQKAKRDQLVARIAEKRQQQAGNP